MSPKDPTETSDFAVMSGPRQAGLRYGDPVASVQRWAVAVRLADGSLRYLCAPGTRRGGQDEWSPRPNQALVFASQADAQEAARRFELNAAAKEYLTVRL